MRHAAVNDANILPNVAIVGRPNVGKSVLFNRLAGRKIAIVHDQPGITRDRISAICTRGARPFSLWDTGGLSVPQSREELGAQVRRSADDALSASNLLLFVVDAKEGLSPIDEELARLLRKSQKPVLLVINKIDNEKHEPLAAEFDSLGFESSFAISAEHDRGTSDLLAAIEQLLPAGREIQHSLSSIQYPISIAVVGRPNVGKSSLINSIVRGERAIVSELPGTTRDAIDILYERGGQKFVFIDTAGIRRRGKHSSSVEVFSVMRAERSIRRADLCVLIVDLTMGVTAQDKRIAGLIQRERKAAILVLSKWDLIRAQRNGKQMISRLVDETRAEIFFLEFSPVLIASALTGENIDQLFALIEKIQRAARQRIGTGVLNRLLRQTFDANPPPLVNGKRLKLFYAAQTRHGTSPSDRRTRSSGLTAVASPKARLLDRSTGYAEALRRRPSEGDQSAEGEVDRMSLGEKPLQPPEFVLFVNDPRLMNPTYRRYLEARIRKAEPYPGLPIMLTLRPRSRNMPEAGRRSHSPAKASPRRQLRRV